MEFKDESSYEKRVERERERYKLKIKFIRESEDKIELVRNDAWLINQERVKVHVLIELWIANQLNFTFENITVEDFIERVLSKFHQKYNIFWEMDIEGDEEDPVFVFKEVKSGYFSEINFRVKEGEFKQCTIRKEIISWGESYKPQPIYRRVMVCE